MSYGDLRCIAVQSDFGEDSVKTQSAEKPLPPLPSECRAAQSPPIRHEGKHQIRGAGVLQRLQVADYSQGAHRWINAGRVAGPDSLRRCRCAERGSGRGVLAQSLAPEGWVVTKASELPGEPTCRLPDGKVVSARVAGVDPAFDLALLSVPATDLKPVRWADDFNPPVGTLLAAVGIEEQPLAVGVVSVTRRDLGAPVRPTDPLPLRIPAGRPEIHGRPRPISGYSLRAAFGLPRDTVFQVGLVFGLADSAGVKQHDLLHSVDGRRILAEADMLEAVHHRRTGDVVPVRLERAGKMMDLLLPVGPETRYGDVNYRADDFPTVIECAVPFCSYECGGPVVTGSLRGAPIGVTIARIASLLTAGMVIPGSLRSEVIARFAGRRISRNLDAGSIPRQVIARLN